MYRDFAATPGHWWFSLAKHVEPTGCRSNSIRSRNWRKNKTVATTDCKFMSGNSYKHTLVLIFLRKVTLHSLNRPQRLRLTTVHPTWKQFGRPLNSLRLPFSNWQMISKGEFTLPYSRFVNWGADKERGNNQRIKQVESTLIIEPNIPFFKLVNLPCSSTNLLATICWEELTALLYNDCWFFSVEAEQFNMQVPDNRTFLIKMYIIRIFSRARVFVFVTDEEVT